MQEFKIIEVNNKIYFLGDSYYVEYLGDQLTNNDRIWFNTNNLRVNYFNIESIQ